MTPTLSTALNGVMNTLVGIIPGSEYILVAVKPDGKFEASHTLFDRRAEAAAVLRRLADQLDPP